MTLDRFYTEWELVYVLGRARQYTVMEEQVGGEDKRELGRQGDELVLLGSSLGKGLSIPKS